MASDNELQFILKMQDQASAAMNSFGSSVDGLSATIRAQMAAMNQLTSALNAHASATHAASSATHEHAAAHHEAAEGAKEHAEEELKVGRALERVANQAKEAAEAMVGLWASNEMARSTVEAALDTEKAISAIARASGESKEAVRELHEEMAKLSMSNGNATIEQLDKMAEAAARMGANKEQMATFAETLAKISNDDNFQAITQGISAILQATGEGVGGVEKLGDALAAMEKHSLHGISGLLPLMERLAGQAAQLGISSEHVAAYAATFEKLGGRPEMAVMAFERTMQKLKETAASGGAELRVLAEQAGMTAADFQKLAQTKPEEAFQKVLQVVKSLQDQGKDPGNFLSRIGIGDEQAAALETMAKHIQDLKKNLYAVDNSGGEADKMADETKESFERALNQMRTAWTEFKASVGEDVMVAATAGFKAAAVAIEALTGFLQALSPEMRIFIEAVVIGTPAVLGLTKIIGAILEAASGALETLGMIGAKIVGVGKATTEGVTAAEEVMVARSATNWGAMAKGVGVYVAAVAAAYEAGKGIAGLIKQQEDMGKAGMTWMDELEALAHATGVISDNDFKHYAQGRKDAGAAFLQPKKGEGEGEKPKEGEAPRQDRESKGDVAADKKDEASAQDILNQKMKTALDALDEYGKKKEDLKTLTDALAQAEANYANGSKDYSEQQLHMMEQQLAVRKAMLDPLFAEGRAQADAIAKAQAYTKAQQEALEVAMEIRKLEEEGKLDASTPNDAAHNKVRTDMQAAQGAERQKSFQDQLVSMNNQLALAGALTQAEKERLQIEQQIAALGKDKGYSQAQLDQLRQILELTKQVEEQTAQFKSLNPQAEAISNYNAQLAILNQRLAAGTVSQAEFNREKAKLDSDSLSARDPIGAIVQSQQEEIAQLGVVGQYRQADLKTLQQITELKKQGVLSDDASSKAIEEQLGANNRMIQDIQDMQKNLDDLTQSFGSGLSQAIGGALNGQKYAFQKFAASLGQKMMDQSFSYIAKSLEPNLSGALGGLFGKATDGTKALSGLGKTQMEHTIQAAQATITANQVTVNGAVGGAATATGAATTAGATPSLPAAGSPEAVYGGLGASAAAFSAAGGAGGTGGQMAALATGGGHVPISWRQNNPGNMRGGYGDPGFTGMKNGYGSFDNAADGYRAANANLDAYARHGIVTPSAIINKWAPAGDNNDPVAYTKRVSQMTGLDPNQPIGNDPETRAKMLKAITEVEGGRKSPYSADQIQAFISNKPAGVQSIATANDPMTAGLIKAGQTAQQQFEQASKAAGTSLKTEMTKANTDIGTDFKTKLTDSGTLDKLSPDAAASPPAQPAVDPTALSGLGNGLLADASKIPGAAPYTQGVGLLEKLFGSLGGLFAAMHSGGVVGRPTSLSRFVNPAIFMGASRFHDGLGDDEFPAILQRGERVLTANQDQRATALMSRMADMAANSSTPAGTQKADTRQANTGGPRVTMVVNTPNASSFRYSQSQIMAQTHAQLARSSGKHN